MGVQLDGEAVSVAECGLAFLRPRQGFLLVADRWKAPTALGIDADPMPLVIGHVENLVDGMDRAGGYACAAVDAYLGIDVGALLVCVEASHRTHRYAIGETAQVAVIRHDMRHGENREDLEHGAWQIEIR